jgi:hypothetical protein
MDVRINELHLPTTPENQSYCVSFYKCALKVGSAGFYFQGR